MKGHERLIEMRRKGWNPQVLTVEFGSPSGMHSEWLESMVKHKSLTLPVVWVAGTETPELLDFRFCRGVSTLILEGRGVLKAKLKRLFVVLQGVGAASVLLTDSDKEMMLWRAGDVHRIPESVAYDFAAQDADLILGGFNG